MCPCDSSAQSPNAAGTLSSVIRPFLCWIRQVLAPVEFFFFFLPGVQAETFSTRSVKSSPRFALPRRISLPLPSFLRLYTPAFTPNTCVGSEPSQLKLISAFSVRRARRREEKPGFIFSTWCWGNSFTFISMTKHLLLGHFEQLNGAFILFFPGCYQKLQYGRSLVIHTQLTYPSRNLLNNRTFSWTELSGTYWE